ncbi:hypothetical protein [Actinomadura chokoriensis]|uniref:GH26 domain-containing protein n=1 Tax=Actinomadura chokoriensis TaxID=454156 RepID=A0ABV4QUL6_9ACTN
MEKRGGMLVGASSVSLKGKDFAELDAAAGPFTVRRSYDRGIPKSWAESVAGIDVGKRVSVWSCKPDPQQLSDKGLDKRLREFVRSIPDSHAAFLTCWHEPDGKMRKGQFTLEEYLSAFRRFCKVVKSVGKPRVYTAQIVEAWSGQSPKRGSTYAELWPGDGYVDLYGVDGYSDTGDGRELWGPAVRFAASKNIPWGIAEVGCVRDIDTSWMKAQVAYAARTPAGGTRERCAFLCWFSNPTGGVVPTPGTDAAARAVAKKISKKYYTDPGSFAL